jgi:hypothetical protein
MAGLYPDDQTINIFGKEVQWPGLDPSTQKFTNGSFDDPLIEPSYIPAETINLILDNLQYLIAGLGQTPNNQEPNQLLKAIQDFHFPVGKMLDQKPDEPTPIEMGLPGDWEIWSHRAIEYGLRSSLPSFVNYSALVGNSIVAGNTPRVCYHKDGDDFRLYQFIAQSVAYVVPADIDPTKWTYINPEIINERQKCGNILTDDDYAIGDIIESGQYAGMYISEIIVPGGKFFGIEGGNRPTFISGGVQGDRIRNITGHAGIIGSGGAMGAQLDGVFSSDMNYTGPYQWSSGGSSRSWFNASTVVPTGPDNAPPSLSTRLWRRVS